MIDYQEIDDYLSGVMGAEEVAHFEEKMYKDTDLSIEVELYQAIKMEGMIIQNQATEKAKLKDTLSKLNQQHFSAAAVNSLPSKTGPAIKIEQPKGITIRKIVMWVASAAAVLLVVFLVKNSDIINKDSQQLFAQYAVADELNSERGEDNNVQQIEADSLFNNKKYVAAITSINNFLANNPNADAATDYKLALGYSYIQADDYIKANDMLSEIANGTSLFANKAKWYLALLQLKQNNTDACIKQLQQIPKTASDYKKAMELLDTLQ